MTNRVAPLNLAANASKIRLTIGVQDVHSEGGEALTTQCEAMAFSPWNALAEHRPMGGINRLRKAVYLASQDMREARGAC